MKNIINTIIKKIFGYEIKEESHLKRNILLFTNESWLNRIQRQGRLYDYLSK